MRSVSLAVVAVSATVLACAQNPNMNTLGERYVRLVLAMGQHDADYVDAYYGPPEWKPTGEKRPLRDIDADATALQMRLAAVSPAAGDELVVLRHRYLTQQLSALRTRIAMLSGTRLTFDQESKALYDAVAPTRTRQDFERVLGELERKLPGRGPLVDRYNAFRDRYTIPKDKVDAAFRAAIEGCRAKTLAHVQLPAGESFTLEYVTGKSWSGYNWYQGNYRSLIQVNTDLPILVDRAVDLACHEGYPGHHVYNVLLEKNLVRDRGWQEYTVYPLFSPQSLVAEGTANYGVEMAFPGTERLEYERRALWPLAGLDSSKAEQYYRIQEIVGRLSYAGNEAARRYLDGQITAEQAADWLSRFALYSPERARQR